jgi:hydroxypyruvate reductase
MTDSAGPPDAKTFLLDLLQAALRAADPAQQILHHLPAPPKGRTVVVGAGKASGAMAKGLEAHWPGPLSGLVIVPHGYGAPTERITLVEAAHPIPDAAGQAAAARLMSLLDGLTEDDLVIALISGGGSALMTLPAPGLTLEDKRIVTKGLLLCGAPIQDINCVRKHLSAVKGGRLAAAAFPARLQALLVSDVAGDDPSVIASGPTVADPTTTRDALDILRRSKIEIPFAVSHFLKRPEAETPKPGDPRLARAHLSMIIRPSDVLVAAGERARELGVTPILLGDRIEGESREVARAFAGMALSAATYGQPAASPCVLLSSGETTVTVTGDGKGGPNGEFVLSAAMALNGAHDIAVLACDTDGIDGALGAAGAIATADLLPRGRALGLDPRAFLANNDAAGFFAPLDALIKTGPTLTNVNDFRAIYIPRI